MIIQEIAARTILVRSRITEEAYCLNPYIGCQHGCRYCYAVFMKRFTGHKEPWGKFVDIKINAPQLLAKELERAHRREVIISSVTDPYQPLERRYKLTRACLEILLKQQFPISILTKSSLVLRDIDILTRFDHCEVGITITTDKDKIRKIFEPYSPPIQERIRTLRTLHQQGIRTYVFIGPILPQEPEQLAQQLKGSVNFIYIDRMNYWKRIAGLFQRHRLDFALKPSYFHLVSERLKKIFICEGVEVRVIIEDEKAKEDRA